MEVLVARQPILNKNQEVYAYELLHRSNKRENFSVLSDEQATIDVINSFVEIGIEDLSEGKPCFINFTESLLAKGIQTYFDPETIVIEVLETAQYTDEFIDVLRKLKDDGYRIALDDFELVGNEPYFDAVLNLADIVKVDIQKTSWDKQNKILPLLKKYGVQLLAEKVETREEYEQCLKYGYTLFQGYFFCKPMIMSTSNLSIQKNNLILIMAELSRNEPDVDKIANQVERDITISYKLLRLINSPALRRVQEIKSIKQAIVLLGLKELKNWISMMYIRETINETDPIQNEITKMSMLRAKTCELISVKIGKRKDSPCFFLTGMFSFIDTLLKQPLEKIINQLPLDKEIKETLLGKETLYKDVLDLVILLEKGAWQEVSAICKKIGIDEQDVFGEYLNALRWTQHAFAELNRSVR